MIILLINIIIININKQPNSQLVAQFRPIEISLLHIWINLWNSVIRHVVTNSFPYKWKISMLIDWYNQVTVRYDCDRESHQWSGALFCNRLVRIDALFYIFFIILYLCVILFFYVCVNCNLRKSKMCVKRLRYVLLDGASSYCRHCCGWVVRWRVRSCCAVAGTAIADATLWAPPDATDAAY